MKVLPKTTDLKQDAEKKETERKQLDTMEVDIDALLTAQTKVPKIATTVASQGNIPVDMDGENGFNRLIRGTYLHRRRHQRAVIVAVSLILGLCFVGIMTSILGAWYLHYYRGNLLNKTKLVASDSQISHQLTKGDLSQTQDQLKLEHKESADNTTDTNGFRIHFQFRFPDPSAFEQESSTTDPFDVDLYDEWRRSNNKLHRVSSMDDMGQFAFPSSSTRYNDDFPNVHKHGDQHHKIPSILDFLSFIRRILNIPDINPKL